LGLGGEPGLGGGGLSVRQQCNRLSSLKIADQRPIALVAAPSPVVDPDDRRRREACAAAPTNGAQQGVVADRNTQAVRKTRRWPASQGEREAVDDLIEPSSAPGPRLENVIVEAFREDAACALNRVTAETPGLEHQHGAASRHW